MYTIHTDFNEHNQFTGTNIYKVFLLRIQKSIVKASVGEALSVFIGLKKQRLYSPHFFLSCLPR